MAAARLVTLGAALALVLPAMAASSSGAEYRALRARDYQFPETVPLESRQQADPERFQCHSDCGNTILDSETGNDDYCDDEAWRGLLDACLECVGEHPIWPHYSEKVQGAAARCGLSDEDATPTATAVASGEATTTNGSSGTPTASPTASPSASGVSTRPMVAARFGVSPQLT